MKKFTLLFAFLAICLSAMAELKIGDSFTDSYNSCYYTCTVLVNDNETHTVSIKPTEPSSISESIEIPATVMHDETRYTVVEIGQNAFKNCTGLESVTFENTSSVTSIGASAFSGCTGLTSVTIPSSVTSLGNNAFSGCKVLTSVTIPSSVTEIGSYAFQYCSELTSVTFEDTSSLTKIGQYAFSHCSELTSVTIPSNVTSIGSYAFQNCSKLTSVTFEETSRLATIGQQAFQNCSSLESVTIPRSVNSIAVAAFKGCTSLTSVTFEGTPNSLSNNVFSGCTNLEEIKIPADATDEDKNKILNKVPQDKKETVKACDIFLVEGHDYTVSEETTTKVGYYRNFDSENWQALFLPFEVSYDEWSTVGQVAELTDYADGVLTWTEKTSGNIAAGTPVIIKPNLNGESKVTLNIEGEKTLVANTTNHNVTAGTGEDQVTLTGTYAKMDMSSTTGLDEGMCYWGLSHGDFYYTNNADKKLKPYRIFLIAQKPSSPSSAPMRINIVGSGTTEIEEVDFEEIFESPAFNLNGQRVGSDYKGIVIQDGKKVLRK